MRLLVVDDQKLFRENLKIVLELKMPGEVTVNVASDGQMALDMCRTDPPDLVLLDMRMPNMDGVEFIRRLREEGNPVKVLALTTFDDDDYVFEALRLGAVGYLLKDIEPADLVNAIHNTRTGGTLISPEVTSKIVRKIDRYEESEVAAQDGSDLLAKLSSRELLVLKHIGLGHDNQEIADHLHLSYGTVKNYVSSIYRKLAIKDRAQAIHFAIRHDVG